MSYTSDKTAYNAAINTAITTQTSANTIPPEEVGGGMTDLADMLEPYINAINNQALLFGPGIPSSGLGVDLDLYFQQGNPIIIYRKLAGSWVEQGQLPLDFTLPDGNLTVQTSIAGFIVSASYGGWVIDGTVYSKSTQTQLTLDAANTNYYRYDNIYATTSGTILYQVGTASASPVAPTLPADTILIDVAIVPSTVSGFVPYLQSGGNGNDLLHRSGLETLTYGATKKWTDGTFWAQLDGGGLQAGNAGYTTVVSNSTISAGNVAGTVQAALSFNGLTFFNNTFNAKLAAATLTANRTITMPDASGTLALLSDISTPSNSITNDTALQTGADFNIDGNGQANSFITTGGGFTFAGTNEGQIINDTLTADRIWKMPNASGILAVVGAGNVTNATDGAMKIKRGTAADTDSILEGLNGAGTTTFSLKGNGESILNSLSIVDTVGTAGRIITAGALSSTLNGVEVITGLATYSEGGVFSLISQNGTVATTPTLIGDTIGVYQFGGYNTNKYIASKIKGVATENWSLSASGSSLEFYTTQNGTTTPVKTLILTPTRVDVKGALFMSGDTTGGSTYLMFKNDVSNLAFVGSEAAVSGINPTNFVTYVYGTDYSIYTGAAKRFTILNNGNTGIGVAVPGEQLEQSGRHAFVATTAASATSGQAKLWSQTVSGVTDMYAMNSAGTSGKIMTGTFLNGSTSYSPSLVAGASAFVTFTVTGASIGDFVMGSFSLSLGNLMLSAHVSAADTVTVVLYNPSGVTQTLGSGTLRARILKV